MIAPINISFKVCIQKIGKKEDLQNDKHHEKFDQND